jgi:probable rRNA maturation factor
MILLDPDLEPPAAADAPTNSSATQAGVSGRARSPKATSPHFRMPSARTVGWFLSVAQKAVRLKGQVTVLLTTDAAIQKLNRHFRGKNKATDVLSFPASGVGAEEIAGDLAISVTTALRQAAEHGHSLLTEIKVLILHGLLHLAGYDHEADAGKMARRERLVRAKLGLPQGLIERAGKSRKHASGAKASSSSAGVNVRAKARTLHAEALSLNPKARTLRAMKAKQL